MVSRQRITSLLVSIGLIALLSGCAAPQKRVGSGQFVDDLFITTRVKEAIYNDPSLNTLKIKVSTFNAVVRLSGYVDSSQSVIRAGQIAKGIEGVKEVKNGLTENSYVASDGIKIEPDR